MSYNGKVNVRRTTGITELAGRRLATYENDNLRTALFTPALPDVRGPGITEFVTTRRLRRALAIIDGAVACFIALIAWNISAQEIGYIETFGLAGDREAALKELVPGTDDYFYYHALQAQNTGQRERFQEVIDRWIRERNGQVTDGARELLNRQALLDYDKDPQKTLKYLREQLDLHFDHARKTGERRSDAPTKFDNSLISAERAPQAGLGRGAGQPGANRRCRAGVGGRPAHHRRPAPQPAGAPAAAGLPGPRGPDPGRLEVP